MPNYTVDSYPIGSGYRGQCKLEYEINHKKGEYRTVRTTTNKHGRWCTPKKSTFRGFMGVSIVSGQLPTPDRSAAWLHVGRTEGVYLTYPNYDNEMLVYCPTYTAPRRKDEVSRYRFGDGPWKESHHKADSPEIIAAYDEYIVELCQLVRVVADRNADVLMPLDSLVSTLYKHIARDPVNA